MDLASVDVQQDIVFENCVVEVEHRYPRSADPNACVIAANKGSILANRTTFISRMLSSEGHPDYTQCLSVTDYHCYQRAQQAPECNFFVGGYPVNNTVIATDCTFEIAPGHDHGWNAHILAGTCPFLIERGLFIAHGELSSQQVIRQEIPGVEMSEQTEESSPGVMKSSNPLGG